MNPALQKAIATRLAAHGDTSGYTVVDNTYHTALPYIRIGEGSRVENSNADDDLYIETASILIFTSLDAGLTGGEMAEDVITALRSSVLDLSADGYRATGLPFLSLQTRLPDAVDADGVGYSQTNLDFEFHTQKL